MRENFFLVKKIYIVYIFLILFFLFVAPSRNPSAYHVLFQVYQATLVLTFAYFLFQSEVKNKYIFYLSLVVYQIILITSYRIFNYNVLGDWLGVGVDGRYYTKLGTDFIAQNKSIFDIIKYFEMKRVMIDDYGMSFIATSFFWFWGADWGFYLLPFLSIVPILIGVHCLIRLSDMLGLQTHKGYLLGFIWGTMTYSYYNCSVGLKENYMVCMVIVSMYFLQKIVEDVSFYRIIIFLFFASTMLFFRTALFYMLVVCLIIALLLKIEDFAKYIWLWLGCGLLVSIPLFTFAINYIGGVRGGVSDQFVNNMYQTKMQNGGIFAPVLNTIVTFVGPIPSFISDAVKAKYITLFSFTSTTKILLSFGYIFAIVDTFKRNFLKLIPLIVFVLLHSIMIWIMFYSLHDRYQWPQYPFILLLSFYGFNEYFKKYSKGTLYKCYCAFVIACILFFNFRVL